MSDLNRSTIYWKWDDSTLESDLNSKIEDLCARTDMTQVFIGLHWIKLGFKNEKIHSALEYCCNKLHERGKKLIIELCPRKEGADFFDKYPEEVCFLTTATEIALDESGKGEVVINTTGPIHYWRTIEHVKPTLLAAYVMDQSEKNQFVSGSVTRLDEAVTVLPLTDHSTRIQADALENHAGRTLIAFVGIPQTIPDLASKYLNDLYSDMLDFIKDIDIDGVMSDEWGYDVCLCMEEDNEQLNIRKWRELYVEHVTYSNNFAEKYTALSGGNLLEDLLYFYYTEQGHKEKSIQKVNAYHETFRDIMRRNDEDMYALAKQKLGKDTFYGVHPTWWGNNYLQNFEGFKNGLYWWEAKRDIAQTDEIVIMPIRTALTHKWESGYWYNMWYSMGTRDINTYYKETWNNVRYAGRTHYLAYECPNEDVVLELKPTGLLESIEEMDTIVRSIDDYQNAAPDCRVLLLFGIENALNWFYNAQTAPPWYPRHKILTPILECADKVFEHYLCDLVPTSEITNGSLKIKNGKAYYGTQDYDAVVLMAPNSLHKACFEFLSNLDSAHLLVVGEAVEYNDGNQLSDQDVAVLNRAARIRELLSPEQIISTLKQWNIATNRFQNGCVLQDGSLIFTAEGKQAVHNPLVIKEKYKDLSIDFVGEDMLYLHRQGEEIIPIYPQGKLILN